MTVLRGSWKVTCDGSRGAWGSKEALGLEPEEEVLECLH